MEKYSERMANAIEDCVNAWSQVQEEAIKKGLERLAAYEDTGLEPEEINRVLDAYGRGHTLRTESAERLEIIRDIQTAHLRELVQAEKDGRLSKYTIGDTIYDRFGDAWEVNIAEIRLIDGRPKRHYRCGHAGTDDYCALWENEVLTREEAEAALKGGAE